MSDADGRSPELNLSAALDAVAHAVLILDARQVERPVVYVNRVFEQLTGHRGADVIGNNVMLLTGPDSDPVVRRKVQDAIDTGRGFNAEWIIHRRDGSPMWSRICTRPLHAANGTLAQIVVTLDDIRDYKQARESLRASEARLELAMEASELSMWDWNVARDEVYYNDQWRAAIGVDPRELLTREDLRERLLLPADQPAVLEKFEQHYDGRSPQFESEYQLPTRDGPPKWFLARAKVVRRDAQGKPLRMIGVLRDISLRKRQLQDARDVEQRWERAVRGTSDGLYDWDLLTGHVWYAGRFRDIVGFSEQEFPDTFLAFQHVLHPDDRSLDRKSVV